MREFDSINAQGSGTISGTVVDNASGEELIGVKYIGYKDQSMPASVAANGKEEIDFELECVVSAARIRDVPDVNAAESVSRLPGISLIRSGGEGQKVAIRGLSPKYNVTMVNGVRKQSTDRNDRSVDLNMIAPNILSGIEVTKALTADMDVDAVGGTVNLKIGKAAEGLQGNFSLQGRIRSSEVCRGLGESHNWKISPNEMWNDHLAGQTYIDL